METIEVLFAAPIPAGHRVRVQWYKEPIIEYGFMSETVTGYRESPNQPVILDLDTQVTYGPIHLFMEQADEFTLGTINGLRNDVAEDFMESRSLEGRVLAARVLTAQTGENHQVQTTLTIEPVQDGGAYR